MKYEFTGEEKIIGSTVLKRIRLTSDLPRLGLSAGTVGGWIESERNLGRGDNAWVSGDARVYDNARVSCNALVSGKARVFGNALVSGNARVYDDARVSGRVLVYDNARVFGNALVSGSATVRGSALVSKVNLTAVRSDSYTFSVVDTPNGPRIIAGCRYFTFEEAKAHWGGSKYRCTELGQEGLDIVELLEKQAKRHLEEGLC